MDAESRRKRCTTDKYSDSNHLSLFYYSNRTTKSYSTLYLCSTCLRLTITVILALTTVTDGLQIIAEHPQNTTARLGDTVVLKCRVDNQKGTLQWVKNGFGLGTTRDLPLFDRYDMVGKLTLGEYHLRIRNITIEDDDLYECQLSPTDNEPIQRSRAAALSVLAEPSVPTFVDVHPSPSRPVATVEAVEDSPLAMACRTTGGRPPARIVWAIVADPQAQQIVSYISPATEVDGEADVGASVEAGRGRRALRHLQRGHTRSSGGERPYVGHIEETAAEDDNGFYTVTSNLTFAPSKSENGKYLACIVTHDTLTGPLRQKSVTVILDVSYRPKIQIEVDDRNSSLTEGGRAVYRCLVDSRPSRDLTVKWSWNGGDSKRLAVIEQQNAMISGLRLKDNGAEVTCTATNSIGTESASVSLNIPYGPRLVSTNQTRLVQRGDDATFECEAVGNPTPDVRWYRNGGGRDFIATGHNFTISDVQEVDTGDYRCVVTVAGFEPVALIHRLHIKGPPIVYLDPAIDEEPNGDVTLSCEIQTRVFPLKIVWLYNNRALLDTTVPSIDHTVATAATSDKRARLSTNARADGVESRLRLTRFDALSHGIYRCAAHNEYGGAHDERDMARRSVWQRVVEFGEAMPPSYRIAVPVGAVCLFVCALLVCCMCCCQHDNSGGAGGKPKRRCCHVRFCCGTPSKSSNYSHNNIGDVVVKCEALDGAQFYPELYGSPPMDRNDFVYAKDYVSVPQSNPDLDYLPSTLEYGGVLYGAQSAQHTVGNGSVSPYGGHQTFMANGAPLYAPADDATRYGSAYGNGNSLLYTNDPPAADSMPNGYYGMPNGYYGPDGGAPLEPLMEVTTPDTENGEPPTVGDGYSRAGEGARRQPPYSTANSGQLQSQSQLQSQQDRPVSRVSTHV